MWKRTDRRPEQDPILELASRLPPDSPIRFWQEQAPAHKGDTGMALLHALAKCRPFDWASHAVAYHELGNLDLSPAAQQFAAPVLEKAIQQLGEYGANPKTIRRVLLAEFLGWTAVLLACFRQPDSAMGACIVSAILTLFSFPFVIGIVSIFDRSRARMVQRAAVTAMIRAGDPTSIVVLEQQVSRPSPIQKEAISALLAILPQVTEDWYGHLPDGSSAALAKLAESRHEPLALLALDALAKAGEGNAAHAVKRLMERTASEQVRERATMLLPILIDRAAHKMAASTLLRPSAYNPTEHLVRPVYGLDPDVTNLLRASNSESGNAPDNKVYQEKP